MKKILTFAVPCYNSEAYMSKCVDSLLPGGEDVEIIIVDDGSTDGTARIADEYADRYPDICRVIHQKNAGHGGEQELQGNGHGTHRDAHECADGGQRGEESGKGQSACLHIVNLS